MKRFCRIWILAFAVVALCGCDYGQGFEDGDDSAVHIPLYPQSGDYIFFDAGLSSRATLLEGTLKENFSVLGYCNTADWETTKVQASQVKYGVFDQSPLTVYYSNNTYEYDNTDNKLNTEGNTLAQWDSHKIYSFFAWYPSTLKHNGDSDSYDGDSYEGEPYIDYTWDSNNMVDVMTACNIDTNKEGSKTGVYLNMKHRLAALDVWARSQIDAKGLQEMLSSSENEDDKNLAKNISDDATITVKVTDLSLTIDGVLYNKAKIYLNTNDTNLKTDTWAEGLESEYTFSGLIGDTKPVLGLFHSDADLKPLCAKDKKMLFIPQDDPDGPDGPDGPVKIQLNVSYQIWYGEGDTDFISETASTLAVTEEGCVGFDNLEERLYHYLVLTFTKSGLFVESSRSSTWDEVEGKTDVDHTFD